MRIFIFGGTSEGRILAGVLAEKKHEITVSVATEMGRECLKGLDISVLSGRLDMEQMRRAIVGADLVIDATHPYATEATANITEACHLDDIKYIRVIRDEAGEGDFPDEKVLFFKKHSEAAEYLQTTSGKILLVTGSKNLQDYADIERERMYVRVLPVMQSLAQCEEAKLPHANIIAMQGPFSTEMNEAVIRQFDISYMVTKESGKAGGFPEKVAACKNTGTTLLVIRAPRESGMTIREVMGLIDG